MGKRANIRATAINTAAIAESNAAMAKQSRRDQLAAQGLIDFNVTDGVVRAVERRLSAQRGEPLTPIGDPAASYGTAAVGAVMFVGGLILAFTGAADTASFWLMLIGFFVAGGAISNANKIEGLLRDEFELEAFQQTRERRRHDIVESARPPRPVLRVSEPATDRTIDTPQPVTSTPPLVIPASAARTPVRRHQRGMRRPTPKA